MASPQHYSHSNQDVTNVMRKLQGRCKMLTHSHSTLDCSVFRGDLVFGMTQQNRMHLRCLVKMPFSHLALVAHDHEFLICEVLQFKFMCLIHVW